MGYVCVPILMLIAQAVFFIYTADTQTDRHNIERESRRHHRSPYRRTGYRRPVVGNKDFVYCGARRHPQNRKYIAYCSAAGGEPSHVDR